MSNTASALIAPGAIVAGKYRLDTVIGEGGMGSVWSATHTGLGQAVAIKFISKDFVTSGDALRRFDAEAKAAAQLRSRHVVQVYDNGTLEDGTPYIAMELLRGESVYTRVHRAGPVPLKDTVEIIVQCCKALGRAHSAGIVHRDIKPDNIFLSQSQDDDAAVVKILDFGIAKFASNPNDHGATRTGAVLGTPLYMSPEQARGLKTIDHRTDLYSLGLVAYTMLTGNLAFSSESFGDLLLQICTAPLPSLRANAPWLPPSAEAWFMRACAREPQDRFASAQELGEALKAACEGAVNLSGIPALAQSNPGGGPMAYGQASGLASAATTAAAATASGMSRTGVGGDPITTPKSKAPVIAAVLVTLLVVGGGAIAAIVTLGKKDAPPATAVTAPAATTGPTSAAATAIPTATLAQPAPATDPRAAPDSGHASAGHEAGLSGAGSLAGTGSQGSPAPASTHAAGGHPVAPTGNGHTGTHPAAASTAGAIDLGY
jgi:serine/threonine-protein kinase